MGVTLLLVVCMVGTDKCNWLPLFDDFVHEKQCQQHSHFDIEGWKTEHKDMEVRYAVCTDKANYLMNAFKA
jgi:hypothetical protein